MRTVYSGLVDEKFIGQTVTLYGWVHRRRDHGGVIFIDLRDREGLVQVVCDPDRPEVFNTADKVRNEYCLKVVGLVRSRPEGTKNDDLISGAVEVLCQDLEVLNPSLTPPFSLDDDNISETARLTYRVLDLRRPVMQRNLRLRYKTAMAFRRFLDEHGFIDIETPALTRSTPEGARDYLVPSRVEEGCFYALPQSPQLFKQMLMVAGFDRYYQIVKCFRDEDLRADRQPEFTQVDIETSFLTQEEIRDMFEKMVRGVFKEVLGVELANPYPVMRWDDAMAKYGSDKPDLRISREFKEITDLCKDTSFKVFANAAAMPNGKVVAMNVPKGCQLPRSEIDSYTEFVKIYGAKGLAYIKVNEKAKGREGLQSPIVKNLSDEFLNAVIERTGANDGDVIFFGADKKKIVWDSLGALRLKIGRSEFGKKAGLFTEGWKALWVIDFPMFEWSDEENRWMACHHPFTCPKPEDVDKLQSDPEHCYAQAYDMVLNGWEIGGGSIRIHKEDVQEKVFSALKITPEEAEQKFGFLLNALKFGAPPHGGIAFGLDRIVAMMTGANSIRDVIAFPKTQRAQCLLTHAPAPVTEKQLRELHIRLRNEHHHDEQ